MAGRASGNGTGFVSELDVVAAGATAAAGCVAGGTALLAAVVGVVASLAVTFGLHVLFAAVGEVRGAGLRLPVPEWSSLRPDMLALSLVAGALLFRFHAGVVATVAAMAAAGLTLMLLRG